MNHYDRFMTAVAMAGWNGGQMTAVTGKAADEPLDMTLVELDGLIGVWVCNDTDESVNGVPPHSLRDVTSHAAVSEDPLFGTIRLDIDTTGLKVRVGYWAQDISP